MINNASINRSNPLINSESELMRRVALLENQLRSITQTLNAFYLKGRLRTDRTAPANSTDINKNVDLLYDRVITPTYEYILLNNSGTLEWVRISASTF